MAGWGHDVTVIRGGRRPSLGSLSGVLSCRVPGSARYSVKCLGTALIGGQEGRGRLAAGGRVDEAGGSDNYLYSHIHNSTANM